ncbi:dihydrolipoamide acetyltransferase family protein [Brevibacterium yomogidense]|uniref:Dihydrolipoamide acetyltransferase component of pyruvate dehydrogenase complex n=1 Tax=Brevibacterium yomogidense TaxID=946573 RepID=A0A1X6XCK3_9MICO|nr:dihydrolipoamide acetyltransferase family protein [Brevibacterium yomogidense]SLM96810.1 Dihydrolipoamide acetyltransferase component of pyruvate dehydrogenase complex [Brevibacterium yomogidense]
MSDVFLLPDPGEGLTEADIVSWKVAAGDAVTVNQILVEIETAKSLVELPSPHAGTIGALLVDEGETVAVGTPIVRFGPVGGEDPAPATTSGAEASAAEAAPAEPSEESSGATLVGYGAVASSSRRRPRKAAAGGAAAPSAPAPSGSPATGGAAPAAPAAAVPPPDDFSSAAGGAPQAGGDSRPMAKPPVRKLAKEHGVDLAAVTPTGARGEVTRSDLLAHLESGGSAGTSTAGGAAVGAAAVGATAGAAAAGAAAASVGAGASAANASREERVPVKGVKKAMANAMVTSAFTSPHVTIGVDVDVTGMMDLVRRLKADRALGDDVRVSPLLIIAKAVTRAAIMYPYMNARMDGDEVTLRHYVNLGIAAATDRGLIVPNIKDADAMGLADLGRGIGELVEVARSGKTPPAAQSGGTITITNVGVFGVDWGTPIINPGESAIVAAGRVQKKPWVVGDAIVPREVMTLTVSADHRVVDGETISKFLRDVADVLEDPVRLIF